MRGLISLLIAAPLLASCAPSRWSFAVPADVDRFVDRRAGCNHFLGEEGYDAERQAFLDRTVKELRCTSIDADERRLRTKYATRPALLCLIDETREDLGVAELEDRRCHRMAAN